MALFHRVHPKPFRLLSKAQSIALMRRKHINLTAPLQQREAKVLTELASTGSRNKRTLKILRTSGSLEKRDPPVYHAIRCM
jgi:hypothetical protein